MPGLGLGQVGSFLMPKAGVLCGLEGHHTLQCPPQGLLTTLGTLLLFHVTPKLYNTP